MKDFRNINPSDYWKILWRRRWYALGGFFLVSISAGIYGWRMPNIYTSQSTIIVEPAIIPMDYVRSSERSAPEEQITAIRQLLQSRTFLERLVQEFQLFGYGSSRNFSMDGAVQALGSKIKIGGISRNTFVISYSSANAQQAQTIASRVVEALIQSSNSSRMTKALEADRFLDEQLRQTEQSLASQEEKIKQFKMSHLGELPEQASANMNALNGLNAQLTVVENAIQHAKDQLKLLDFRAQEQKRLGILARSVLVSPTQLSPAEKETKGVSPSNPLLAAKQAELRAMTSKYTSSHPDVVRLAKEVEELKRQSEMKPLQEPSPEVETPKSAAPIQPENAGLGTDAMLDIEAAEMKVEAENINNEIAKHEKEREVLLGQIRTYQNRLNSAPALEQEFMSLSREHEALKQQYANLQGKKFQSQLTANLEANSESDVYKVIDEADLPDTPAFPDRKQIILIGLGAGFAIGIGVAFIRELLDTTLGSEDEVAAVLKLPALVTISEVPRRQLRRQIGSGRISKSA
jgi:polysaccharide chain length determinant protein (PEP-CTERM system associated)